jgi:polyhydroxyalkanoate synthesis regulator phasin
MKTRRVAENLSEEACARDMVELRERVVKLEVQLAELTNRVESLSNYSPQLFEYLNKLSI